MTMGAGMTPLSQPRAPSRRTGSPAPRRCPRPNHRPVVHLGARKNHWRRDAVPGLHGKQGSHVETAPFAVLEFKFALKNTSIFKRDRRLFALVAGMDVRKVMAPVVPIEHQHQDPVERRAHRRAPALWRASVCGAMLCRTSCTTRCMSIDVLA